MNKTLYLLCGVPGAGKSTYVKEHLNDKSCWCSRDNIRFSIITEDDEYFSKEDEVFEKFINSINTAIFAEHIENIYVDATHLSEKARNKVLDKLSFTSDIEIIPISFECSLATCLYRNMQREGLARVPKGVIRRMYYSYEKPTFDEKYSYANIITIDAEER